MGCTPRATHPGRSGVSEPDERCSAIGKRGPNKAWERRGLEGSAVAAPCSSAQGPAAQGAQHGHQQHHRWEDPAKGSVFTRARTNAHTHMHVCAHTHTTILKSAINQYAIMPAVIMRIKSRFLKPNIDARFGTTEVYFGVMIVFVLNMIPVPPPHHREFTCLVTRQQFQTDIAELQVGTPAQFQSNFHQGRENSQVLQGSVAIGDLGAVPQAQLFQGDESRQ